MTESLRRRTEVRGRNNTDCATIFARSRLKESEFDCDMRILINNSSVDIPSILDTSPWIVSK
jgi:hypothetical protein